MLKRTLFYINNTPNVMQLDLFTWETEQIVEGYKHLLLFDFEKSILIFKEVLKKYTDNKEALTGSVMAYYWNKIFKQCGNFDDKDDLEYFYMEIVGYDFDNTYGLGNFKNALVKKLIGLMQQKNMFFIQYPATIADLYIDLNEYEPAKRVLTEYLKQHPNDGTHRCRLADVQWVQGERKEAKRNYTQNIFNGLIE